MLDLKLFSGISDLKKKTYFFHTVCVRSCGSNSTKTWTLEIKFGKQNTSLIAHTMHTRKTHHKHITIIEYKHTARSLLPTQHRKQCKMNSKFSTSVFTMFPFLVDCISIVCVLSPHSSLCPAFSFFQMYTIDSFSFIRFYNVYMCSMQ